MTIEILTETEDIDDTLDIYNVITKNVMEWAEKRKIKCIFEIDKEGTIKISVDDSVWSKKCL